MLIVSTSYALMDVRRFDIGTDNNMNAYSIYRRANEGPFIVQFVNPKTGKRTNRSTRTTNRREAERVAKDILDMTMNPEIRGELQPHYDEYISYCQKMRKSSSHVDNCLTAFRRMEFKTVEQLRHVGAVDNRAADLMANGKLRTGTVNGYLRRLKCFCNWLYDQGKITTRIKFKALPQKMMDKRLRGVLTEVERDRLLNYLTSGNAVARRGLTPQERHFAYAMALYAGLRRNEITGLHRDSINFEDGTLTLLKQKNGQVTNLPLNSKLLEIIKAMPPREDGYFLEQRRHDLVDNLYSDYAEVGIPKINNRGEQRDFHALRNSFVTHLIRAGADIKSVQELARHSDPAFTLRIYARVQEGQCESAVDLL